MRAFRFSRFAIAVFVVIAALAASLLLSGCGSAKDGQYKEQVQACIDEYNEAYNAYTMRVIQELGAIDPKKALTEEDIAKIHEINDEFETATNTALDKMAALDAPTAYEDVQKKIDDYVEAMKEIAIPSMIKPLDALEVGETLSHYSTGDGKPTEQKAAVLKRANADFVEALKKIDINLDIDTSHATESTGT